jgi:hypothetical protein
MSSILGFYGDTEKAALSTLGLLRIPFLTSYEKSLQASHWHNLFVPVLKEYCNLFKLSQQEPAWAIQYSIMMYKNNIIIVIHLKRNRMGNCMLKGWA